MRLVMARNGWWLWLGILLLSACGGGGGGSDAPAPTASFSASPLMTSAGSYRFNASASTHASSYAWDFGDGGSGQGKTIDHTYAASGSYSVTLTVSGGGGSASVTKTLDVRISETISGSISTAAGMMADSDTNAPDAVYVANDTPDTAQLIANPVLLGGYANEPFHGPSGPSFESGDVSDFFKVELAAGQTITLNIADHLSGDLDLYLYDSNGIYVDESSDTGKTESLTIAADGSYFIEVYVYRGYSNYNLVVGQEITSAAAQQLSLKHEFVPGEIIVQFKQDQAQSQSQIRDAGPGALAAMGLQARAGAPGRPMLLSLGDTPPQRQTVLRALAAKTVAPRRSLRAADAQQQAKLETLQAIKALRQRKDILYAEPNYILRPAKTPLDAEYGKQWHYRMINLPNAWDVSTGSSNVVVAVVDTGVLLNHPDLSGQLSGGYDFILSSQNSGDNEPGIDANPDDPGDSPDYRSSSSFHGSHVAGTIAAKTSFDTVGSGVAGVAPNVKIMPLRVLGKEGGTLYDIHQALRFAAGLSNDSGTFPAKTADIINLSLGGGGYSQSSQDLYNQLRALGVIVVAAAGNEASSAPSYPASYDNVISVSAVDANSNLAPYSNSGSRIDVAAPGGNTSRDLNGDGNPDGVLSTVGDDSGGSIVFNYKFYQGTSMAAPHVAGVIALMKSLSPGLTPVQVDNLLSSGALSRDLGTAGRDDKFGHGLIDAAKAVQAVAGGVVLAPNLYASPEAVNLALTGTTALITLGNAGGGTLNITSASSDAAWLSVTAESVDGAGLGSYRISANRDGLAVGIHRANLSFVSDANTLTLPVIMQVGDGTLAHDAGLQYVLLINSATQKVVQELVGNFADGKLSYQFSGVPFYAGQRYFVISGSDMDNDGFICDSGESCGAYLALDLPVELTSGSVLTDIDFFSGFEVPVQSLSRQVQETNQKERSR